MKTHMRPLAAFLVMMITASACVELFGPEEGQPSANQVSTAAAMTLQALSPETVQAPIDLTGAATSLLPHPLYFLAPDTQGVAQLYRLARDGKTKTQLTFETANVDDYDVSLADGSLLYVANNQLLWADADGSNRHLFVDGGHRPVFSPDGKMLAFAWGGVNLYDRSTGASSLVIQDHPTDGSMPLETYQPVSFSPDGTKLLISIGYPPDNPSTAAIYTLATQVLAQFGGEDQSITCCDFYGGAQWSADGSTFYTVGSQSDSSYKFGQLWRVDSASASVVTTLTAGDGTINLPYEPYLAPDGQLYFFLGSYNTASGFFDAPRLEMVRAAADGRTGRTVLRDENFVMMNEALWAPEANFVVVATAPARNWNQDGGVLELYYADGQKGKVWLAPFGKQMKWGS